MKTLIQDVIHLWQSKWLFKAALLYLTGLCILIFILPVLPLPYAPNDLDLANIFLAPFKSSQHLLGTDQVGRDVLVNILYGARNGLFIAIPVMLLSGLIGTILGSVAGYFGNYALKLSRSSVILMLWSSLVLVYYLLYLPWQAVELQLAPGTLYTSIGLGVTIIVISWLGARYLKRRLPFLAHKISFPADSILLRAIELGTSLPKLLVLISVSAFTPPSVLLLSVIFICTFWPGTARLARAEMLRIKQLPYMEAAQSIGMTNTSIILKEAIPNITGPIVIAFIFGVSGLLAIESTLSFLGIGLPATFPSWGGTIAGIRSNLSAWWLVVFPGGLLALTVLALQTCSFYLVSITQERQKS